MATIIPGPGPGPGAEPARRHRDFGGLADPLRPLAASRACPLPIRPFGLTLEVLPRLTDSALCPYRRCHSPFHYEILGL
jgi:hypothetical protein